MLWLITVDIHCGTFTRQGSSYVLMFSSPLSSSRRRYIDLHSCSSSVLLLPQQWILQKEGTLGCLVFINDLTRWFIVTVFCMVFFFLLFKVSMALCILLYPGLILIDFGHFQYPLTCEYSVISFVCMQ